MILLLCITHARQGRSRDSVREDERVAGMDGCA